MSEENVAYVLSAGPTLTALVTFNDMVRVWSSWVEQNGM